jgi:hypothetical protein
MLHALTLAAALTFAPFAPASPGSAGPVPGPPAALVPDETAVLEVVNRLFDAMRARDGEALAAVFHPAARLVTTGTGPDGAPRAQVMEIAGFVQAVGAGGEPWNEPIFDTEVRIDGNLAQVWTFYRFYAGETFSHCGYNAFLLVRDAEGLDAPAWRIVHLADSRRTTECER